MTTRPALLRDVHFSGKWSATEPEMATALNALAVNHDRIRLTEVSPAHWRKFLKAWAKAHGWHVYHPRGAGKAECAILSRYPFALTGRAAFKVTSLRLKFGRTDPTYVIARRTKGWGWADVLHTPAHNEGLRPGLWPTRVYRSVLAGIHRLRLNAAKRRASSADFNLDTERGTVKATLEAAYPGMDLLTRPGQKPTEGGRVIDTFLMKGLTVVSPEVTLTGLTGFDHRPVRVVFGKANVH